MESKESNYELARNQNTEADDCEICCMHGLLCHVGLKTYNDTKARNKQEKENSSEEGEKESKKLSKNRRPSESSSNAGPSTSGNSAISQPQFSGETDEFYIGVRNYVSAEGTVLKPGTFRLYHQYPHHCRLDTMPPSLQLTIVYKTSQGFYRHYPVKEDRKNKMRMFYVEFGTHKGSGFKSIDQLIKYYKEHVYVNPNNPSEVDVFPWKD
ncbi:hypothetical protein WR25_12937 [Diploscapter pachys]|uniref:SH2 domain-containing protein n=1 Tax=Diploscapter pachys TaxID=2018661 RepID=A0A2A2LXK0_9BILA|nr:hypothetical protein WR25_12937 [Diploscapter pachys]